MTRRIWLLSFILSAALPSFAGTTDKSGKLRITVNLPGIEDTLQIRFMEKENTWSAPSPLVARHGKAKTSISIDKSTQMVLMGMKFSEDRHSYRPLQLRLIAFPGEKISITGTVSEPVISGSSAYQEYGRMKQRVSQYKRLLQRDSVCLDYIENHPNSEVSVMLACELGMEAFFRAGEIIDADRISDRTRDVYLETLRMYELKRVVNESAKRNVAGITAPDFTLNDINGKPLTLSSLRGKYVILDFWGSWCSWCIKGFPEMKNYYEKYKGKFEILGVDCNDTEQKWKDAVKKSELPWLHVFNPRSSNVISDYGIQGYPTKIIIDPDGKIVKTIVGEDPAFYTILDELFK